VEKSPTVSSQISLQAAPVLARALVVSIHDVSPLTRDDSEKILAELREIGVEKTSLLVIPNHHRRGHFLDDAAFCEWLKTQSARGHEIVMHGYFHQRVRRENESARAKIVTRFYTADEGEFFDLDENFARALVEKSRAEFAEIDLHPRGFIAPAWLLSDAAERALRELRCEYTTRLKTVSDFVSNTTHDSQSLCWSVRSGWRRATSLAWNAFLFQKLRENPLLRVSIHPPDVRHEKIWRQICVLVSRALEDRAPMTYETWASASRPRIGADFFPAHDELFKG